MVFDNEVNSSAKAYSGFKLVLRYIMKNVNTNTYFILLYTIAVIVNGLYGLHIDTNDILMCYGVLVGKNLINHGINSTLNSDRGKMPERLIVEDKK